MKIFWFFLIVILTTIGSPACFAYTISGLVIAVVDGDTISIIDAGNTKYKVRLAGIDSPEKSQSFGERSKQNMVRMVFGRSVQVEWQKEDRYGRIVGKVLAPQENCRDNTCPKSLDVGLAQIAVGLAWHYKKYEREQEQADRVIYSDYENQARAKNIGLWSEPNPIAPWNFRRKK